MVKKSEQPGGIRKNALSHGAYAHGVLPWERQDEFVALLEALQTDLEPEGLAEEEAVLGIARLYWNKRRVGFWLNLAYRGHPNAAALTKAGESGWSGVEEYLASTSNKMQRVRDVFRRLAESHAILLMNAFEKASASLEKLEPSSTEQLGEKLDRIDVGKEVRERRRNEQLVALLEALNSIGTRHITLARDAAADPGIEENVAEHIFRPDIIEKEVRIGALIDRQIEKGLAQLVHLKEYKRMYKKKQVTGPA
jgi:hypothetical protein